MIPDVLIAESCQVAIAYVCETVTHIPVYHISCINPWVYAGTKVCAIDSIGQSRTVRSLILMSSCEHLLMVIQAKIVHRYVSFSQPDASFA